MMNFVALGLIFTSLFTSAILSPTIPAITNQNPNQITLEEEEVIYVPKQGLSTVITVQYEKDGTKISISTAPPPSPFQEQQQMNHDDIVEGGAKNTQFHRAKELICDAFGKCRHKILGAKDKVVELEEEAKEAVESVGEAISQKAHGAKECTQRACGGVFKTAVDTGKTLENDVRRNVSEDLDIVRHHVAEKAKQGVEKTKLGAETATGTVKDAVDYKVKREVYAATQVRDKAKFASEKVKSAAETVKDKAKGGLETTRDAMEAGQDKAKQGFETVEAGAENVKHAVQDKFKQGGNNGLIGEMRRMPEDVRTYVGTVVSSSIGSLLGVIHLLGFAMAYGMSVWITFVSSYVLAEALPRQQFGMVQSKIYPLYFRAMAYSIGVALVGHILSERRNNFQGYNLIASLLMVFANLFYLEPRATKVMYERMKMEKEEGRGERIDDDGKYCTEDVSVDAGGTTRRREMGRLNERLKMMNSMSSTLNILTLTSLTWHLVYLGQCLHMTACP